MKPSSLFAIDPGNEQSGFVMMTDGAIVGHGIKPNDIMLEELRQSCLDHLAIEMIASYGMPVGKEVFDTCVWIGRFIQAWNRPYTLVYRKDVKIHLCGTLKAKDTNIRQALIDKLGPQGTAKNPGPTYGIKSHIWAALGVAVTAMEAEL